MHVEHAAAHTEARGHKPTHSSETVTCSCLLFCTQDVRVITLLQVGYAAIYSQHVSHHSTLYPARGTHAATHSSIHGTCGFSLTVHICTWDARRLTFLYVGHARFPTPDYVETCLPHGVQVISQLLSTRARDFPTPVQDYI
jgi:hypothetical protein